MLSQSVEYESRKRSIHPERSRSNSRSFPIYVPDQGNREENACPSRMGHTRLSRYFLHPAVGSRLIASNSFETRIFFATRSNCLSVSTSTCELDTLRESLEQAEFYLQNDGAFRQALPPTGAIGMANAAINTLLLLSSDGLLGL